MAANAARRDVHYWRAADLAGAELLRGRFRNHVYPPHVHDAISLALITGGAIEVQVGKSRYVAHKGSIVLIRPGEIHSGRPVDDTGWKMRSIHIDPQAVRQLSSITGRRGCELIAEQPRAQDSPVVDDAVLADILFRIHWCSENDGPSQARAAIFRQLVNRLASHYESRISRVPVPASDVGGAVRSAQRYLAANLDKKITLTELSRIAQLPRFSMWRAFLKAAGMTPHAWQVQLRIRTAAERLRHGESPAEVAFACGFSDQAHLTRTFRSIVGVTPGAYRSAH